MTKQIEPPNDPKKAKEKAAEQKTSDEADLIGYTLDDIDEAAETILKAEEIKNNKDLMPLVQNAIDEKAKALKGVAGLRKVSHDRRKELLNEK